MKVTCQSCQAKYTIADEKVRGKVAKIRCKKCSATIVVDGTDPTQTREHIEASPLDQASSDPVWTLQITPEDQRTVDFAQVEELLQSGVISADTLVWGEGMDEWQAIREVQALAGALAKTVAESDGSAQFSDDPMAPLAATGGLGGIGASLGLADRPATGANLRPSPRDRGGDLFGQAALAGGELDMLTHAQQVTSLEGNSEKPLGARNESSVLFSLSSLTGGGPSYLSPTMSLAPSGGRGTTESSALVDLQTLLQAETRAGAGSRKPSKVDDIMHLGGGGVFSPSLAAPSLAAMAEPPRGESSDRPKKRGNGPIYAVIGGLAVVAIAGIWFATAGGGAKSGAGEGGTSPSTIPSTGPSTGARPTRSSETAVLAAPTSATTGAPLGGNEKPSEIAPSTTVGGTAPTAVAPGAAMPAAAATAATAATRGATEGERERPARPTPTTPRAETAGGSERPVEKAAPKPAAPPAPAPAALASEGASFDRSAALSTLGTAASSAQSCKRADGPTGGGRVAVTFANNGNVTTATIEGPPFSGTTVGGCVAAKFRSAHVPPFGGGTITVHKSFSIN